MSEKTTQSWSSDPQPLLRADKGFRLDEVDPHSTPGYEGNKKSGRKDLKACIPELDDLQERLFAAHHDEESGPAVLLILQAMDTAGKGGIVRHVVGSVDPQGVELAAFKAPDRIEFGELPKPISGKIRRVELRQREDALAAGEERAPAEYRDDQFPALRG